MTWRRVLPLLLLALLLAAVTLAGSAPALAQQPPLFETPTVSTSSATAGISRCSW